MRRNNLVFKYIFLCITYIVAHGNLHCQNTFAQPTFKTPEAASFMKFIDNQVNLYNGSVDVSIPVYTINDGGIEIPITLRYNTSGLKVAEEASWVGLGWNLNVGGMITLSIKGEQDDPSYFTHFYNSGLYKYCNKYGSTDKYFDQLSQGGNVPLGDNSEWISFVSVTSNDFAAGRLTPDVYYFNFLNYSGKFYINPTTSEVYTLDASQNIKFTRMGQGWKAIAPDGTTFLFATTSYTTNPESTGIITGRNFYLDKIIYPSGEVVTFEYDTNNSYNYTTTSSSYLSTYGNNIDNRIPSLIRNNYTTLSLAKISTPNFRVFFNTNNVASNPRLDLPGERKLESIVVQETISNSQRKFSLNYDYFTATLPDQQYYCNTHGNPFEANLITKRLKLVSFGEDGLPLYEFSYLDGLPVKSSYAVDYWGYYNGSTQNTTFVPNLKQMYPGGLNFPEGLQVLGSCRAANPSSITAGLLYEIKYPTGGKRRIDYESNTFKDYFIPSKNQLDKLSLPVTSNARIEDYNSPNDVTSYQFNVTSQTKVGITGYISRGIGTYDQVKDAYIELRYYTTSIKKWQITGYDQSSLTLNIDTVLQPRGFYPYVVIVSIPNSLGNQTGSGTEAGSTNVHIGAYANIYTNTTFTNNLKYCYGGGIRVKRELLFDSNSTNPSLIYKYDYDTGDDLSGNTSGLLMTPLQFYAHRYKFLNDSRTSGYDEYEVLSNNFYPANEYSMGATVAYSSVTMHKEGLAQWYTGNSTYTSGKTVTYFYNETIGAFMMDYVIGAPLPVRPLNGKIRQVYTFDNNNNQISFSENNYSFDLKPCFWGLHMVNDASLFSLYGTPGCTYPISAYYVKLNSVTTTQDNVTSIKNFQYNGLGQLASESAKNSDDVVKETLFKYPYDLQSQGGTILNMYSSNILSPSVTKEVKVGGNTTYKEENTFLKIKDVSNGFDNIAVPLYNITSNKIALSGGSFNHITNVSYDNNARLKEYSDDTGITTSFAWGYNSSLPVIKAVNLTYASLSSATLMGYINQLQNYTDMTDATVRSNLKTLNNNIRGLIPSNAMITTYTYSTLYGMTSQTDPNGVTTYYEYDIFGQLKCLKDDEGRILKTYEYHYKQ